MVAEKDYIQQRLETIKKLRESGVEPYAYKYSRSHTSGKIQETFSRLEGEQQSDLSVGVVGRLVAHRAHGKTIFIQLQDESGRIQVYFRADELGPERFELIKQLDVGDFLGAKGTVFRTRTGELTIRAVDFALLSKALRPMPEKWHGLKDVELRYRQRYLDILANEQSRNIFLARSRVVKEIRKYLDSQGFMEVETPMMQPLPGGAAARPFMTHHNALNRDLYLRVAPELYLKRLLVGGFEKIFEMNRSFRNEGISTMHNPEFTMLEVYQAYVDANAMMELMEKLVAHLVKNMHGGQRLSYQGQDLDLKVPWKRLGYTDAIKEQTGIDIWQQTPERLAAICQEHGLEPPDKAGRVEMVEMLFESLVEPKLIQPTFIIDFPLELSPLAKQKAGAPDFADRFEPYVAGHEIANGFSELNDPMEQRRRFELQMQKRAQGDEEAQVLDEDFIRALEYGMPPAGGLGIGIDRLVMLLTDSASIREVIFFPQLRRIAN
ncbi:lysine--tRNA ligase, partial [bacterium]|nr:lysine--tRNA ligase [bacterium]